MKILAIESSCDETAAAVVEGRCQRLQVLSNIVSSQIKLHRPYGGVVPELAAREHILNILPVVQKTLSQAGLTFDRQHKPKGLGMLAVTAGPGLATSLLVGVETAKALAYAWQLPLLPINHIAGHIYSVFLADHSPDIKFPAVILTVSGGHNLLVLMTKHLAFHTIGETRDDAAGEAFDKGAKLLGLGYPGGPAIAKAATLFNPAVDPAVMPLPRPMIKDQGLDFSFSGLKTALLYALAKDQHWNKRVPAYASEYQAAIIDVLTDKTIKAAQKYKAKTVILSGGVSANELLRQKLPATLKKTCPSVNFYCPPLAYTTDNAAMIASAAYRQWPHGKKTTALNKVQIKPNWEL